MKNKYVLSFVFDEDLENVLLIEKQKPDFLKGKLNGIGGACEKFDIDIWETAERELKEETGIFIHGPDFVNFGELNTDFGIIYLFYAISDDIWEYQSITNEKVGVYNIDISRYNILPNLKWMIPMALNHYKKLDDCQYFEIRGIKN